MNEFHHGKAALPRDVRNAPDLRNALRAYIDKRLLHVSNICLQHGEDSFRKEYGLIHKRYANTLTLVAEATQDVNYLTKSVIEWINEDFNTSLTGAQRGAAGICGAELLKIVESYEGR
jgi:hypothetical protein|tara:strand:+ start:928 stop:1281 length:354 start_codon:yes stop_codon:yes gene_type:complete